MNAGQCLYPLHSSGETDESQEPEDMAVKCKMLLYTSVQLLFNKVCVRTRHIDLRVFQVSTDPEFRELENIFHRGSTWRNPPTS